MKHGHRVLMAGLGVVTLALALTLIAAWGQASMAVNGIIYVDADAGGENNGTSWADAYTDLQLALGAAVPGNEIWVAAGTYKPTSGSDRTVSFQMKNGVAIYGGFDPSVDHTEWEDRDWVAHPTILSGDIGTEGASIDNSYHVFYHPEEYTDLDSTAILDGFTITGGNASGEFPYHIYGGGMYNAGSSPMLTNCTFQDNWADGAGGGMANLSSSSPTLTNCTFEGNSAGSGGGMYNLNASSPTLTACTFDGNSAADGGGVFNGNSSPTLANCTFFDNSAGYGGGMENGGSSPVLVNCTFWGNSAIEGGGMYNSSSSSPTLTNCILWGNSTDQVNPEGGTPVITYCDVQDGYEGEGNIDADPLFVDPTNGDLHLGFTSPCIDVGNNAAPGLPEYDFERDDRILDGDGDGTATVDMGVDEVYAEPPPPVIYVDADAEGANDGTSWADAYTDLQDALGAAVPGNEIWVAAGTYKPTSGSDRTVSFQMKNGVAIYGGFDPSVGDTEWEDRDWVLHETILSGDIGIGGELSDNSYHVFYHSEEYMELDSSAILDGFTISGGNANGEGGGMVNYYSSPTLTNCTFVDNSASTHGGGMVNYHSSPTLTDCTFSANSAGDGGGGMLNFDSSPTLTDCAFSGNSAGGGGGMHNAYYSSPVLVNCAFEGNWAGSYGGGGMLNHGSSPLLTNCTFTGNSADENGGGIYNGFSSSPTLTNCILWGDTPQEITNSDSTPVVTYSDVQGGYPGESNLDTYPFFVDAANGDLHLRACSRCIDAGYNLLSLPDFDFEGDDRIVDGDGDGTATVDMGVDEVVDGLPCWQVYLPLVLRGY